MSQNLYLLPSPQRYFSLHWVGEAIKAFLEQEDKAKITLLVPPVIPEYAHLGTHRFDHIETSEYDEIILDSDLVQCWSCLAFFSRDGRQPCNCED